MLGFIKWDVSPEIFDGYKTPNLYGLLFVSGLAIGYYVIKRMFKKEGISDQLLDKLVLYVVIATIVGARLGHVLFYGPYFDTGGERGYFSHPEDIFKIWEGGLASHGGAIALVIALWLFSKRIAHKPFLWILDKISAPIAVAGCFIRLGNLANSEIVGDVTNVPWGFQFLRNDCFVENLNCAWEDIPARHPAQLYEALSYILIFAFLLFLYWKRNAWKRQGLVFGWFLILLFGARFMVEFVKLGQTARDAWMPINTGQMLSIPFIIAGVYILWRVHKNEEQ